MHKTASNFEIPKTIRFLALQEYDLKNPDLAGVGIQVWVDPPYSVLAEYDVLNAAYAKILDRTAAKYRTNETKMPGTNRRLMSWLLILGKTNQDLKFKKSTVAFRKAICAWFARMWSQAADPETHWTAEKVEKINEKNPQLFDFLIVHTWALIEGHGSASKKIIWDRAQNVQPLKAGAPIIGANTISPRDAKGLPGEWLKDALAITSRISEEKKQGRHPAGSHKNKENSDVQ